MKLIIYFSLPKLERGTTTKKDSQLNQIQSRKAYLARSDHRKGRPWSCISEVFRNINEVTALKYHSDSDVLQYQLMSKQRTRSIISEQNLFSEETLQSRSKRSRRQARPRYLEVKNYEIAQLSELSGSERDSDNEETQECLKKAFKKKPRGSFLELAAQN